MNSFARKELESFPFKVEVFKEFQELAEEDVIEEQPTQG